MNQIEANNPIMENPAKNFLREVFLVSIMAIDIIRTIR